jgi:uncharacterized membrane protein (UPF0127 family)
MPLPVVTVNVKGTQLKLEVAATPEARTCGLSRREVLPMSQGMLFVEPRPRIMGFWMHGTRIPLSVAFLDDAGRILSIQQMDTGNTTQTYLAPLPVRYAIEVSQGWFAQHLIGVGDIINIELPADLRVE